MIYIEADEDAVLPKEYHRINNLCALIYGQLTDIIKGEAFGAFRSTQITLNNKNQKLTEEILNQKIHLLDWLKANQLDSELTSVLRKHVTMSILVDFVHFVYESLRCAKKGKMTVAYALLRKPFTDELLIFEQLLADPKDFIQRFYHSGDPEKYDPSKVKNKKQVIGEAIAKLRGNIMFTDELLLDFRYNKEVAGGLNGITNSALHIVTSDKNYKTERQNLNFIFALDSENEERWSHYYNFVPYLLLYSVSVIDSIIFAELKDEKQQSLFAMRWFRRAVALIFLSEWTGTNSVEHNQPLFDMFSESTKLNCPKCNNQIVFDKADFELYLDCELLPCTNCMENLAATPEAMKIIESLLNSLSPQQQTGSVRK